MPYDELAHCLETGQEPLWGPFTWLTVACGVGCGFVGYLLLGPLGVLLGAALGLALPFRYHGVAIAWRVLLLAWALVRRDRVLHLGGVVQQRPQRHQVKRMVEGQPRVVIKRGRL